MNEDKSIESDIDHLEWLAERRSDIQRTLLALNGVVIKSNWGNPFLIDHLIAAAFSLWRAVFLAEADRDWHSVFTSQKEFLANVVSGKIITCGDDKANRAWTVGYYLQNAKLRLGAAYELSLAHKGEHSPIVEWLKRKGHDIELTRYEWESAHAILRILFNALNTDSILEIRKPTKPRPGMAQLFE
jgi:hypothetical protein